MNTRMDWTLLLHFCFISAQVIILGITDNKKQKTSI